MSEISQYTESLHEECGVFGMYDKTGETDMVNAVYSALYALQHRGQESCGIALNVDGVLSGYRDLGLVSMAFCFAMAYIAEQYFGIADITGAYIAGIVLCAMDDAPYVERRVDISNYVIFAPVFFASIGLKTDISGLTPEILLFCICFVIVALLTKIIGCGLAAKICRFNWGDSLKVGVGMMTRGEVALIVAQKGLEVGVVDPVYFTAVILLIVVSSVATPLALKALFTKMPPVPHPSQTKA